VNKSITPLAVALMGGMLLTSPGCGKKEESKPEGPQPVAKTTTDGKTGGTDPKTTTAGKPPTDPMATTSGKSPADPMKTTTGKPPTDPPKPIPPTAVKLDTPQAVFELARTTVQNRDWRRFLALMTEDGQDVIAAMAVTSVYGEKDYAKKSGEKLSFKETDAVLSKHGLTQEHVESVDPPPELAESLDAAMAAYRKLVAPVKDKPAFVAELMQARAADKLDPLNLAFPPTARLENVEVTGDAARGTLAIKDDEAGTSFNAPIKFKKVGDEWRIDAPLDEEMFSGGGGKKQDREGRHTRPRKIVALK